MHVSSPLHQIHLDSELADANQESIRLEPLEIKVRKKKVKRRKENEELKNMKSLESVRYKNN